MTREFRCSVNRFGSEGEDGLVVVGLAGAEDGGREAGFVGGVGEELGFERKPVRLAIGAAGRAVERAVQEVAA